jgi:hypothetical protein
VTFPALTGPRVPRRIPGTRALPVAGPIGLTAIYAEFAAPLETPLTEMVMGGVYVTPDTTGGTIPSAPPISLLNFLGATAPARVSIASVTGGATNITITPSQPVCDFDLPHSNLSGGSSVSATVEAIVTLRLDKPSAANVYLTCLEGNVVNGVYLAFGTVNYPPSLAGADYGVGLETKGPSWQSSGGGGQANWQPIMPVFGSNIINRNSNAVLLASNVSPGQLIPLTVRAYHALSVLSFTPINHQGTGRIVFNPVLQFRDAGNVVRDEVPLSFTVDTSGQLTAVS